MSVTAVPLLTALTTDKEPHLQKTPASLTVEQLNALYKIFCPVRTIGWRYEDLRVIKVCLRDNDKNAYPILTAQTGSSHTSSRIVSGTLDKAC